MLIALLVALGVDLIVIVGFVALVVGRRRHLKHQPGQFFGAVRAPHGEVAGLAPTWKRGSGRWVGDVLVWSKAPFMYRTALIPVDGLMHEHEAAPGDVERLGDHPVVVQLETDGATIEVATRDEDRSLLVRSWSTQPLPERPATKPV